MTTDRELLELAAVAAPLLVLLTSTAFYAGRRRERRELWPEVASAERYKHACRDVLTWCCEDEFRAARRVAAHIMANGEGESLNAGTPRADEPCTVDGLREQLRHINTRAAAEIARAQAEGAR